MGQTAFIVAYVRHIAHCLQQGGVKIMKMGGHGLLSSAKISKAFGELDKRSEN